MRSGFFLFLTALALVFPGDRSWGQADPPPFLPRVIAEVPSSYAIGGSLVCSPDGAVLAVPVGNLDQWAILVNEERGRWFDRVGAPSIAPDGRTVVYAAAEGNREFLVRNHIRQTAHTEAKPDEELAFDAIERFVLSQDSKIAYLARKAGAAYLVIGRVAHPLGASEKATDLWFDPISGAVVCVSEDSKFNLHVYLNGREDPEYRKLGEGYRVTIEATEDGKAVYLGGGKPGEPVLVVANGVRKEWDGLREVERTKDKLVYCARKESRIVRCSVDLKTFQTTETLLAELPEGSFEWTTDPAGANVAYIVLEAGKARLVVKGPDFDVQDKGVDLVDIESVVLDPKSKTYAYRASDGKEYAVVNGKKGKPWDFVSELRLSPSAVVVYRAERGGTKFAVVDGKVGPGFEEITDLAFAPDGKTIHYKGLRGEKSFLVIGDRATTKQGFDDVKLPGYSGDGKVWAYRAREGESWRVVVNGVKDEPFSKVEPPMVSPSGQTVAYVAHTAQGDILVHSGNKGETWEKSRPWEWIFAGPLFSPEEDKIAFGALRDRQFVWKVLDLGERTR